MDFAALEKSCIEKETIFADKKLLSFSYAPSRLVSREKQEAALGQILVNGVKSGFSPSWIRVFGGTGSGKTVVVRKILSEFESYQKSVFRHFYCNLKNCRSVFSAANSILSSVCGKRVSSSLGLNRVFSEIWKEIGSLKQDDEKLFCCLVLDEADSVFLDRHLDPSDFFYSILRASNSIAELKDVQICLITICNNMKVFEDNLDARVKSCMGSDFISFTSYSRKELEMILVDRASEAFKPGFVEDWVLEYCAELVFELGGDARKAIELLKVCGEIADEEPCKVLPPIIDRALKIVNKDCVAEALKCLPDSEKHVMHVLALISHIRDDVVSTSELHQAYSFFRKGLSGWSILGERRVLDIVNRFETFGFVNTYNISKGRGGYRKQIALTIDPKVFLEANIKQRSVLEISRKMSEKMNHHIVVDSSWNTNLIF